MPSSKLEIATSALSRLVREEGSYHKELEQQEARVKKLEEGSGDENREFMIRQERQGIEETKKMFPNLRNKIKAAIDDVEKWLETVKEGGVTASTEEITKAKEAISAAKTSYREIA